MMKKCKYDTCIISKHKYAVDIPSINAINNIDSEWINLAYFSSKEEALKWAQEHLGADKEGKINVISSF